MAPQKILDRFSDRSKFFFTILKFQNFEKKYSIFENDVTEKDETYVINLVMLSTNTNFHEDISKIAALRPFFLFCPKAEIRLN